MSPGDLLTGMADHGIGLAWGPGGRVRLVDPGHELNHARFFWVLWYRPTVEAALIGSLSGHRWHRCGTCGVIQLLRAVKANDGRKCWEPQYRRGQTIGCPGHLHPIPLEVPKRPRTHKVSVTPVPFGLTRLGPDATRPKSRSPRTAPRAARAGDLLTLVECAVHRGPRWVRRGYVDDWRCAVELHDNDCQVVLDDESHPLRCELPAVRIAVGTLAAIGADALVADITPTKGGEP
jgi:hypothetical protein